MQHILEKKKTNELRLDNSNRLWKTIRSTVLKLALSNLKFRTVAISMWKLFHSGVGHFLLPPGSPRRFSGEFYSEFSTCLCFVVVVGELMEERF